METGTSLNTPKITRSGQVIKKSEKEYHNSLLLAEKQLNQSFKNSKINRRLHCGNKILPLTAFIIYN